MQKKKSHHILLGIATMIGIGGIVASVLMIKNQPTQTNYNYIKKEVEVINPVYKSKEEIVEKEVVRKNLIKDKQYYYDELKDIVENKIKINWITTQFQNLTIDSFNTIEEIQSLISLLNDDFFEININKDELSLYHLESNLNVYQLFKLYETNQINEIDSDYYYYGVNIGSDFNTYYYFLNNKSIVFDNEDFNLLTLTKNNFNQQKQNLITKLNNIKKLILLQKYYKEILETSTKNDEVLDFIRNNKYINYYTYPNEPLDKLYNFMINVSVTQ